MKTEISSYFLLTFELRNWIKAVANISLYLADKRLLMFFCEVTDLKR